MWQNCSGKKVDLFKDHSLTCLFSGGTNAASRESLFFGAFFFILINKILILYEIHKKQNIDLIHITVLDRINNIRPI